MMFRVIAFLLALTLGASAQVVAPWQPGSYQPAPTNSCCLLDTLASPVTAAYSFRKLRAAYAGSAVQVKRASDSTTQDIGFVSNLFDTGSYNTFCNATTCSINIWYDQSTNGSNWVIPG